MKKLALLSLSIAVALGMPPFAPGVAQNPVLTKEDQSPLLGDFVPVQGHVVVEDPAPQFRQGSEEQLEKLAPVPLDMEQSMVELEIKVKPQVGEKKVKTEAKKEPEIKVEQELKPEPEVKVDLEADVAPEENLNPQVIAELKVDEKPKVEMEPELKDDPDFKVESEVKVEPEVQEEFQVQMNLEAETKIGREIEERHIDMEGKYKVVGEPIMELEPLDDDNDDYMSVDELSDTELSEVKKSFRAAFQNQDLVNQPLPEQEMGLIRERSNVLDEEPIMELETPQDKVDQDVNEMEPEFKDDPDFKVESEVEVEPDVHEMDETKERHIDMEGKYEIVGKPITEFEPLDDDHMELSEFEKSLRAAFQNQNTVNHPLPDERGLLMSEMDSDGEPIMELVPLDDDNMSGKELSNTELSEVEKSLRAAFQNQKDGEPIMELETEGEVLIHQQVMPDAAIMKEGPALDIMGQPILALEEYFPNEEARMGMEQERGSRMVEESHYLMMEEPSRVSRCSGVMLEGKCYQFFKGPKGAADAELFCQENFPGGHLASVTSQPIHREVMNMMLRQNVAHTRTWIGGLRYLQTGRFIWLDGSHWGYADWLSGEPNNTADVEECVEVLAHENGKFNDFTCSEAQAFICSYSY
ncbi:titin [Etheostoma spectabile]|uniref:titin n=1 Tax=Etheostoma spectabile TaxID=54343 RepID=UPI0013AF269D|nr:titin-like [Etheostoma spectabile]